MQSLTCFCSHGNSAWLASPCRDLWPGSCHSRWWWSLRRSGKASCPNHHHTCQYPLNHCQWRTSDLCPARCQGRWSWLTQPWSPYHSSPHSWAVQTCSWCWCSLGTGPGWHCWAAWWPWVEGSQCAVRDPSQSCYEATAHALGHRTPAAWCRPLRVTMLLSLTTLLSQESKLAR